MYKEINCISDNYPLCTFCTYICYLEYQLSRYMYFRDYV